MPIRLSQEYCPRVRQDGRNDVSIVEFSMVFGSGLLESSEALRLIGMELGVRVACLFRHVPGPESLLVLGALRHDQRSRDL